MFGVGKLWRLGESPGYAAIPVLLACLCILLVVCSESSEKKSSGDKNRGESASRSESNSVEDTTGKERTGSKPKALKKAAEKGDSETTIENEPTETTKGEATQKEATREKTEEEQTEEGEDPAATFLEDYYRAVSDEDWSKTYSYLTIAAQDEFTEEEWATVQSIRASQNPRPPIVSVETVGGNAAGDAAIVDVLATYEDGTEEKLSGITIVADAVNEPYGIKRGLSESDVEYLRGLLEGS